MCDMELGVAMCLPKSNARGSSPPGGGVLDAETSMLTILAAAATTSSSKNLDERLVCACIAGAAGSSAPNSTRPSTHRRHDPLSKV